MNRNTVILIFTVLLLSISVMVNAAGPKFTWTIVAAGPSKSGCTIIVADQFGTTSTIDGNTDDLKGLSIYFGVSNPEQVRGYRLEGNSLEQDLNSAVQWALRMDKSDRQIEELAKGLITLKTFNIFNPLSEKCFTKNQFLRKDLSQKLGKRIHALSNSRLELGGANIKDFIVLPTSICFSAMSLVETIKVLVTPDGNTSSSIRTHLFTLSANCTNAVLFDQENPGPRKLTEQEME